MPQGGSLHGESAGTAPRQVVCNIGQIRLSERRHFVMQCPGMQKFRARIYADINYLGGVAPG